MSVESSGRGDFRLLVLPPVPRGRGTAPAAGAFAASHFVHPSSTVNIVGIAGGTEGYSARNRRSFWHGVMDDAQHSP
jgi:hypothetical protein